VKMPVLFVGHGNPMNAIERNEFHLGWHALGRRLPRPKSILCVSAHWESRNAWVMATDSPETIHDFYGFPKALFDVRYPAPGEPALAARISALVASERVRLDPGRGLDHGAWSVLIAMYPLADVPVVQLSMDTSTTCACSISGTRRRSTGRSPPTPGSAATSRRAVTTSSRNTRGGPKRASRCRRRSTICPSSTQLHCNNRMNAPNSSMSGSRARSR